MKKKYCTPKTKVVHIKPPRLLTVSTNSQNEVNSVSIDDEDYDEEEFVIF